FVVEVEYYQIVVPTCLSPWQPALSLKDMPSTRRHAGSVLDWGRPVLPSSYSFFLCSFRYIRELAKLLTLWCECFLRGIWLLHRFLFSALFLCLILCLRSVRLIVLV